MQRQKSNNNLHRCWKLDKVELKEEIHSIVTSNQLSTRCYPKRIV